MTEGDIQVTFVVPCFRSGGTVGATLKAILEQAPADRSEVIVVDSSADGTAAGIRSTNPRVRVVESAERLLPGAARNRGAETSRGRLLAFIDADAEPGPTWLSSMMKALETQPDVVLAGGWVRNANPETVASRLQYWLEFSEYLPGMPSSKRARLSSSNCLIRREDFIEAGAFSASLAMSEDSEFCSRLKGHVYFESASGIAHTHRTSLRSALAHLSGLGYWSGLLRRLSTVSGSGLSRAPILAFLLPFYRAPRICTRLFRADTREGVQCLLLFPVVLTGLFWWSYGFYRGLKGLPVERP